MVIIVFLLAIVLLLSFITKPLVNKIGVRNKKIYLAFWIPLIIIGAFLLYYVFLFVLFFFFGDEQMEMF